MSNQPTAEELLDFLLNAPADDYRWPHVPLTRDYVIVYSINNYTKTRMTPKERTAAGFIGWLGSLGSAHVFCSDVTARGDPYVTLFLELYPEIAHQLAEAYKYEQQP